MTHSTATGESWHHDMAVPGGAVGRAAAVSRDDARKHIEKRRALQGNIVAYVVINAFLVAIWALAGGGYFWPIWVMVAWGLGVVFQVWDYLRGPVTEADVDAEVRRMRAHR
jgi:hypothetical protein